MGQMAPATPGIAVAIAAAAALLPATGRAWIYPEHRDIAISAIAKLSPADRAALDRLWADARSAIPGRLCESLDAGDQGSRPGCIDFAAWPALSGDHSCSPLHLTRDVLPSDWVLRVAAVGAGTKAALKKADGRVATLNAIASSNLALQRADAEYATRAGANNAHFLLPRVEGGGGEYVRASVGAGAPLNAMGLYVQYHLAALAAAAALASDPAADEGARAAQALAMLALEGYALHWLEDAFSAGHVVGTRARHGGLDRPPDHRLRRRESQAGRSRARFCRGVPQLDPARPGAAARRPARRRRRILRPRIFRHVRL